LEQHSVAHRSEPSQQIMAHGLPLETHAPEPGSHNSPPSQNNPSSAQSIGAV
jgi:hypothetical protein